MEQYLFSEKGHTIPVLYQDNHLLVVNKPAGVLVQGDHTGDDDLLTLAKRYLKEKYHKPGNVYLGLVHRLDRPVSGVVVLARTSKAAGRLSEQIRERTVKKRYLALVEGHLDKSERWLDSIARKGKRAWISPNGKRAELSYKPVKHYKKNLTQVAIDLQTGRHHQIRLQFSSRLHPVLGDTRYGSTTSIPGRKIALHAQGLTLSHPTKKFRLSFFCRPDSWWDTYFSTS